MLARTSLFPDARKSVAVIFGTVLLAAIAGYFVGIGQLLAAVMVVGGCAGLAVIALEFVSLSGWLVLLLLCTVLARTPVELFGLPDALNFLHYPVAIGFALSALHHSPDKARLDIARPNLWLVGLGLLCLLSLLANASHPMRAVFFLLIVGEPLLIMWSLWRWEAGGLRTLGAVAALLILVQIPLGVWQGATLGWNDPVRGTLMEHGAGAHVLGGLFALVAFVAVAGVLSGRLRPLSAAVIGLVSFLMILAAGAMAVAITAALTVAVMPLVSRPPVKNKDRWLVGLRGLIAALVLSITALLLVEPVVPGIFERTSDLLVPSESPVVGLVKDRAKDPLELIFGAGPGTTASRASLLLTTDEFDEGSPLAELRLPPTDAAIELSIETTSVIEKAGGSAETSASSALGIVGDLGLLGFVGLGVFFWAIWRAVGKTGSWLMPAVRASLLLIAVLMFLDNWLEYPEFSVPLAILIGCALRTPPRFE